jgi:hypothetical protein
VTPTSFPNFLVFAIVAGILLAGGAMAVLVLLLVLLRVPHP